MTDTQQRVQRWFRAKRRELLASADLAADHPSLVGGHREYFTREFLGEFLPKRLSADRGIVYNFMENSGECDIVIWDSVNFPRMAMLDHSSFFAQSVVAIVEVKSRYSQQEYQQCIDRCRKVHRLKMMAGHSGLQLGVHLLGLENAVYALQQGYEYHGMGGQERGIAYVVVFVRGGESVDLDALVSSDDTDVDEGMPDAIAFIESGTFVRKFEPSQAEFEDGEDPLILLSKPGEHVLMALADEILRTIATRSVGTDGLWDLGAYKPFDFSESASEVRPYTLGRLPSGWTPFFAPPADPENDGS